MLMIRSSFIVNFGWSFSGSGIYRATRHHSIQRDRLIANL